MKRLNIREVKNIAQEASKDVISKLNLTEEQLKKLTVGIFYEGNNHIFYYYIPTEKRSSEGNVAMIKVNAISGELSTEILIGKQLVDNPIHGNYLTSELDKIIRECTRKFYKDSGLSREILLSIKERIYFRDDFYIREDFLTDLNNSTEKIIAKFMVNVFSGETNTKA